MRYLYQDTGLIRCAFGDQIHLDGKNLQESHKIGDSGMKIGLNIVPLSNMTHAAPSFPSFLCDNKLNTAERGAADVMFKRGTEITRNTRTK